MPTYAYSSGFDTNRRLSHAVVKGAARAGRQRGCAECACSASPMAGEKPDAASPLAAEAKAAREFGRGARNEILPMLGGANLARPSAMRTEHFATRCWGPSRRGAKAAGFGIRTKVSSEARWGILRALDTAIPPCYQKCAGTVNVRAPWDWRLFRVPGMPPALLHTDIQSPRGSRRRGGVLALGARATSTSVSARSLPRIMAVGGPGRMIKERSSRPSARDQLRAATSRGRIAPGLRPKC